MDARAALRWTTTEKVDAVLRMLKGEEVVGLAAETRVPVDELLKWKHLFVRSGTEGLKGVGRAGGLPGVQHMEARPAESAPVDDPELDWRLESERLERIVTELGESILERGKIRKSSAQRS